MRTHRSGNCGICGVWRKSLHRDHIIPKFRGGPDTEDNCQYICANCHEDKTREDLVGRVMGPMTDVHKFRISVALKGVPKTAEHRSALRGRKLSDEQRLIISLSTKGIPKTSEHKEKLSLAAMARWKSIR